MADHKKIFDNSTTVNSTTNDSRVTRNKPRNTNIPIAVVAKQPPIEPYHPIYDRRLDIFEERQNHRDSKHQSPQHDGNANLLFTNTTSEPFPPMDGAKVPYHKSTCSKGTQAETPSSGTFENLTQTQHFHKSHHNEYNHNSNRHNVNEQSQHLQQQQQQQQQQPSSCGSHQLPPKARQEPRQERHTQQEAQQSLQHVNLQQPSQNMHYDHDDDSEDEEDVEEDESEDLASDHERRQLLVDIFYERHLQEEQSKNNEVNSDDEEQIREEDYCWFWDEKNKSDDVLVHNCGTEAYFHPDYSCGTAAIRGNRQFREGEEHYWEVQMSSAVYGTDMMIGVGSSSVNLDRYKSQFCSLIGKEVDSWGISYFGTVHHNGTTKNYCSKFERGAVIGCHLDLWKGTLSFFKNGIPLGIAFDGLLGKQLFPMISSTAARTKMKLVCCYKTSFSLQYMCCKEISKQITTPTASSNKSKKTTNFLDSLPLPRGLKRYIGWRMEWVFKLNNAPPPTTATTTKARTLSTPTNEEGVVAGPRRKRVRSKNVGASSSEPPRREDKVVGEAFEEDGTPANSTI